MSVQQQFMHFKVTLSHWKPYSRSVRFMWLKQDNKDNNLKNNSLLTTLGEFKNVVLNTSPTHCTKVLIKDIKDIKGYFKNCLLTGFHNTPNSVQFCTSISKTNFTFERKCWNKEAFIPLALFFHCESCSHANIQLPLFLISTYMGIAWYCWETSDSSWNRWKIYSTWTLLNTALITDLNSHFHTNQVNLN